MGGPVLVTIPQCACVCAIKSYYHFSLHSSLFTLHLFKFQHIIHLSLIKQAQVIILLFIFSGKKQDILLVMSSAVASQAGQVLREIFKIPSRAREQVGQSWRTRFWQTGTSSLILIFYPTSTRSLQSTKTDNPQNDQRKKSSSLRSISIDQSGSPALRAPTPPRMPVLWP